MSPCIPCFPLLKSHLLCKFRNWHLPKVDDNKSCREKTYLLFCTLPIVKKPVTTNFESINRSIIIISHYQSINQSNIIISLHQSINQSIKHNHQSSSSSKVCIIVLNQSIQYHHQSLSTFSILNIKSLPNYCTYVLQINIISQLNNKTS